MNIENEQDILEEIRRKELKIKKSLYDKKYKKSKGAIKVKINHCKEKDFIYDREFDIDEEFIKELIDKQKCICNHCNLQVKLVWEIPNDPLQFSINRINNKIGHIKENVEITCWNCNNLLGKKDRFKRGSITKLKNINGEFNKWCFKYYIDVNNVKIQKSKTYSIKKHGFDNAYNLCVEYQNLIYPI